MASVDGAKYFVTFTDEVPGPVSTCHMKMKGEMAELRNRRVLLGPATNQLQGGEDCT